MRPPSGRKPGVSREAERDMERGLLTARGLDRAFRVVRPVPCGREPGPGRDMERGLLTARGLDRTLRVAWTITDLAGGERPGAGAMTEALQLRTGVPRGVPELVGGL